MPNAYYGIVGNLIDLSNSQKIIIGEITGTTSMKTHNIENWELFQQGRYIISPKTDDVVYQYSVDGKNIFWGTNDTVIDATKGTLRVNQNILTITQLTDWIVDGEFASADANTGIHIYVMELPMEYSPLTLGQIASPTGTYNAFPPNNKKKSRPINRR